MLIFTDFYTKDSCLGFISINYILHAYNVIKFIYIVPVLYIHQFDSSWFSFSLLPARKTPSQKRNLKSGSMPEPTTKPKRFAWNILDSFLFGSYQHDKKLKSTAQQLVVEATSNAWSKWVVQPRSSLWCLMISRQSQYLWTWMVHWSFNAILFFLPMLFCKLSCHFNAMLIDCVTSRIQSWTTDMTSRLVRHPALQSTMSAGATREVPQWIHITITEWLYTS